VESETFVDARYCYALQESAIVFLMGVALVLRQEALSLVVAMVLVFSLKMNAGHPLFELQEPSC
jgi:hypothetical protein